MFMMSHFGWRAALAIVVSTLAYYLSFKRELLGSRHAVPCLTSTGPRKKLRSRGSCPCRPG
jgi:hypothetical protein